jgi:MFS transporter, UMF1 family
MIGFPHVLLFVAAFIIYNDGIATTIAMSSVYAADTLRLDAAAIALTFLIVQFVAFPGSLAFGWLAGRMGAKGAILVSLVIWVGIMVLAYRIPEGDATQLFLVGALVRLVLGGAQALSRSLYGSMIPEAASAEFFGFYSVFSKFSAIWGPLIFALVSDLTGSARNSILS